MSAYTERKDLVRQCQAIIAKGSQSFAFASSLFDPDTRDRALMLYAWCRAADDMTDGQTLGHGSAVISDQLSVHHELVRLTKRALDSNDPVPLAFAALRQVSRETGMPRHFITDHLAGFELDSKDWIPETERDLLQYCYHVAGAVGCMMAVVMGVPSDDEDTLDRACDLGLAFQLANIARDIVPDAAIGRCYLPSEWLREYSVLPELLTDDSNRGKLAIFALRLISLARCYRTSSRIGAARLPFRSRLAVLTADEVYGAIGEKVVRLNSDAWNKRVSTSRLEKLGYFFTSLLRSAGSPAKEPRTDLWTRPRHSRAADGERIVASLESCN
jgi:15-cis-phytoene synthase